MASYPFYRASAAQAQALGRVPNLPNANIGLWFTRFYDGFKAPSWEIDTESKRGFIDVTVKIAKQGTHGKAHLEGMAKRQKNLCEALGGVCHTLRTSAPLLTGSGLSHPVENGFTFHPTLGVPYLPASGVKGVLRAWVEVWSDLPEDERQRRIAHWFGAAKGTEGLPEDQQEQAGALIFFDALPLDWIDLRCDILTPHMGKWYEKGGSLTQADFAQAAPGDWYSPVPSPFLVVDRGASFLFGIAPRCTGDAQQDALAREAAGEAMETLLLALEWVGYGAKTAAGYGRLHDKEAEHAKELVAAGIAQGQEEWPQAQVSWNKGKVELVVQGTNNRCVLMQQPARDMRAKLSAVDQSKLDKGKPVKAVAVVEQQGNQYRLVDIKSLSV